MKSPVGKLNNLSMEHYKNMFFEYTWKFNCKNCDEVDTEKEDQYEAE